MLHVKDIMTRNVISVKGDDSVRVLIEIFNHAHISGTPVLNEAKQCIGIVSKTDLSDYLVLHFIEQDLNLNDLKISAIMSHYAIVAVEEQDTVSKVSDIMRQYRIHRVLIKNNRSEITGILTASDIARAFTGVEKQQDLLKNRVMTDYCPVKNELDSFFQSLDMSKHPSGSTPFKYPGTLLEIPKPTSPYPLDVLSARELQVLGLIAECKTNPEIMDTLGLAEDWLKGYIANILSKLNVPNEVEAVKQALESGIIERSPLLESDMPY